MKIFNPLKEAVLLPYPSGAIFQGYGENIALYMKAIGYRGHNGIDLVAKEGTPLLATEGTVVEVKNDPTGYGKHLRIFTKPDAEGNFLEITYGHNKENLVSVGQEVKNGDEVALMGNTGFVISGNTPYWGNAPAGKGVHCHFGVRELCKNRKIGNKVTYSSGASGYVKNYNNGLYGSVDPMRYLLGEAEYTQTLLRKLLKILLSWRPMKTR